MVNFKFLVALEWKINRVSLFLLRTIRQGRSKEMGEVKRFFKSDKRKDVNINRGL